MCAASTSTLEVDLLTELQYFYRQRCPDKINTLPLVVAKYQHDPDSLKQFLEAKYAAPGFFRLARLTLGSPLLDPLACLYEEGVVVPEPDAAPLDNINRCRQLVSWMCACMLWFSFAAFQPLAVLFRQPGSFPLRRRKQMPEMSSLHLPQQQHAKQTRFGDARLLK
jgi:hypothetical protein